MGATDENGSERALWTIENRDSTPDLTIPQRRYAVLDTSGIQIGTVDVNRRTRLEFEARAERPQVTADEGSGVPLEIGRIRAQIDTEAMPGDVSADMLLKGLAGLIYEICRGDKN